MVSQKQEFDYLPQHSEEEIDALREDLRCNGLISAVIIDEDDNIIDGKVRAKLCDELEIDWHQTASVKAGLNESEKASLRIKLNIQWRKALPTAMQRRKCAQVLIKAEPNLSNGSIGQLCGLDHSSVSKIRKKMIANGEADTSDSSIGIDGRIRQKPAKRQGMEQKPEARQVIPLPGCEEITSRQPSHQDQGESHKDTTPTDQPEPDLAIGWLAASTFHLKLVKDISEQDGCWEWTAQDDEGNRYHLCCQREEPNASQKKSLNKAG